MHNQKRKTQISLAAILFLVLCMPVSVKAAEIWSGATKITAVYPTSDALAFMTEYSHPQSTCDNSTRFMIAMSHPNYDVLASVLLAAFHSGKNIRLNFDQASPSCAVAVNRFQVW